MTTSQRLNADQAKKGAQRRQKAKPINQHSVLMAQQADPEVLQRAAADPARARPADILALQHTVGNRAVSGLIQAKLTVGPVGDQYEQEADRVARQVMRLPALTQRRSAVPVPQAGSALTSDQQPVRRQAEEEELQAKPLAASISPLIHRQVEEEEVQMQPLQRQEEEEELQAMPAAGIQRLPGGPGMVATPELESAIQQARGGGQSLAGDVRVPMEQAFGADFSGVRVHTDKEADALNRSLQAKAFTTGKDIFFQSGAYQPASSSGQQLLAHELTHTMQQGASTRIARWAPLGTSHSKITKQALNEIEDHDAKRFYQKRNIRSFIRKFAEDMDNREAAKPGWEQIKAYFKREYPVYKKMGRKKGPGGLERSPKDRQKAWLNIEGYSRDRTEQVNHAETGMYELGADEGSARDKTWGRINAWFDLAVKEGKKAARQGEKGRWNDAFMYLGLALHTIEDIGAHGYGIPGKYPKGHDPRRFVKPPPVPEGETRPEAYDLYLKGASFGDCDKMSTNRAGHREAVTLAKNQLELFAAHFAGITPKLRKYKLSFLDKLMGRKPKAEWSKWKQFYYPTKTGRMVYTDSKKGRKAAQRDERRRMAEHHRQREQFHRELKERLSKM